MLNKREKETLLKLADAQSSTFVELVRISGLDPSSAFRGADLRGVDFTECDLRGFDFSHADLSGATFRGASVIGATLDGAILKNVEGLGSETSVSVEEPSPALGAIQIKRARWVLCGFGRSAQAALRSREITSRSDLVVAETEPEALDHLSSLIKSRVQTYPCELVFVCDSDPGSISAAIATVPLVADNSPPSLVVVYRSDRPSSRGGSIPGHRLMEFKDQAIIVDSHVEIFKGRTRFTPGRLVRSYLDTVTTQAGSSSNEGNDNVCSIFSLGSHPRGVEHAISALKHAIAASINPLVDTLSARELQITVMSVGEPTAEIESSLRESAASAFNQPIEHVDVSWRQLKYSGYSVPVQIGLLAKVDSFYLSSGSPEAFFKAVERVFQLSGVEWELKNSTVSKSDYMAAIGGKPIIISAIFDDYDSIEDSGSSIYCVVTNSDRRRLYESIYSETNPILLLSELRFVLESDNPVLDARHIYRVSSTRDSLRNEFTDDVSDYIRSELFSSPSSYELYQPLQDLSRNTIIEDVDINIEKAIRMAGFSVRFIGSMQVSVELDYGDKDANTSDSYPGSFDCTISFSGPELTSATIDVSSFYE